MPTKHWSGFCQGNNIELLPQAYLSTLVGGLINDTENRNVFGIFLKKIKKVLKKGLTNVT